MSNNFDQFIQKHVKETKTVELDLEKEKSIWLDNIDKFYELAKKSLEKYIDNKTITFTYVDRILTEELLGSYSVKEVQITIGREVVKLCPIGTFLIGARGRIDMIGPKGKVRFTIVPPTSTGPKITFRVVGESENEQSEDPVVPPEMWVWKIATPPPRISYIDLTCETFQSALMEVING
ncbi:MULTISPECIES: hypothetical protein [Acinetobacter calcoaceticus/baumannii complex]|uniref:Uncharacterized protein n=1 Tax=Acinetobacter pittii TaxID=48296 RepID=A0A1S8XD87_ACIPI|nr:hypothetical protein [Acinetobacter pittii]MDC5340527.1 hypothetical protein [Acinetobacter baumannii]AQV15308.1 hypothetical protein BMU11_06975 [Acinetobacter pittii]MDX8163068.1 hypothetical protein [Acinetobacter pittii]OON24685.1 hypothetical protein BI372_15200 [Acinetobacter pittii]QIT19091.1 hypothetical protein G8E09_16030 [Acinetobacter pittii]